MFVLRTFGGLSLNGPDGPVGGRATQRRRLAVLAVLAHARGQPLSRDRLIGLFWPDSDSERARHLLADSIYVLRSELGGDVLLAAGDDLSLNSGCVASDIADFLQDLDAGDLAGAVDRYARGGPFLDGVYLSGAPEFERWVEATRAQVATQYRGALEALAGEAAGRGDREGAAGWWRRLAGEDRLSSRVAQEGMRSLAAAGDVAGALDLFRTHERAVQADLDLPPDPAVVAFAEELRRRTASPGSPGVAASGPAAGTEPAPVGVPSGAGPRPVVPRAGFALGVVLLASISFGVWQHWRVGLPVGTRSSPDASLVVLPLEPADPADGGLADGLTDELIAVLARTTRLRVIAHTSAFAFKGRHLDVRRIADSLRVSYVMEGTLQRSGSRLRVQLRLIDGRDGTTRWSQRYDRPLQDVFDLQADIGAAVTHEIRGQLGDRGWSAPVREQTGSIAAYELYLRGVDPILFRSDSGLRLALEYLSRAVALDPSYAAAHAALSYRYTVLGFGGREAVSRRALYLRAESAARRALALDDSLGEAHMALGFVRMRLLDFATAEKAFNRALALDPTNRLIRETASFHYGSTGQYARALIEAQRSLMDDPLSATAHAELAGALLMNDRCDEALEQLDHLAALRPPLRRTAMLAARCHMKKRRWSEAIARLNALPPEAPQQALLAYALAQGGRRDEAQAILDTLLARYRRFRDDAFEVGVAYAGMGEMDQAFSWLNRSVDELSLRVEVVETTLDKVRHDARWDRLRSRVGLRARTS